MSSSIIIDELLGRGKVSFYIDISELIFITEKFQQSFTSYYLKLYNNFIDTVINLHVFNNPLTELKFIIQYVGGHGKSSKLEEEEHFILKIKLINNQNTLYSVKFYIPFEDYRMIENFILSIDDDILFYNSNNHLII